MNYKVYQGEELKQTVTSKIAVMNGLQPNQSYVFGVQPDNGQTGVVGANLIVQSDFKYGYIGGDGSVNSTSIDFYSENYIATNGETVFTFSSPDYVFKGNAADDRIAMYDSNKNYLGWQPLDSPTQTLSKSNVAYIRFCINSGDEGNTTGNASDWLANHRYKLEKGSVATTYVATTSVTTRGIRFNIPKTLTVGSTITLRYEEYPLGIVPIGNEPSGYFGGGNKQNLSAKVISTSNGSSVVEVAGNAIEVGGRNLLLDSQTQTRNGSWYSINGGWTEDWGTYLGSNIFRTTIAFDNARYSYKDLLDRGVINTTDDFAYSIYFRVVGEDPAGMSYSYIHFYSEATTKGYDFEPLKLTSLKEGQWVRIVVSFKFNDVEYDQANSYGNSIRIEMTSDTKVSGAHYEFAAPKLEPGTIATPYASFVDGDTFTAQPDGTCALFSEHKALYY